jgi:rfaE bifunctional protein kinase chain/domain
MSPEQLFAAFANIKVAIIGDVMLDTYWWGHVDRISPEAPVPVVALDKKEYRIGGAANVALNTAALGADTFIFSVIGNDEDGILLASLLQEKNINTAYLLKSEQRTTTNKTRIMSRNQQMMRLDSEMTADIATADEDYLIEQFQSFVASNQPQVVIFEDYNKGVLTEKVITTLIDICKANHIITTVDPKRKNFFAYKGITMFKPNLKEVKEGLNLLLDEVHVRSLEHVHSELKNVLHHQISLITLSEKGVFFQAEHAGTIIPTHVRNIADVSGAGDTVIAVASLVYAISKDIAMAAEIANIAGGLVCEEVGTVAIDKKRLLEEVELLLR